MFEEHKIESMICMMRHTYYTKMTDTTNSYTITAARCDNTYSIERWQNVISSGKSVIILVSYVYRDGEFTIELTNTEKDSIIKLDEIHLSNYSNVCCERLREESLQGVDIESEEQFTETELNEINALVYVRTGDGEEYDNTKCYDTNAELLDANCWLLNDTLYGFTCNCELYSNDDDDDDDDDDRGVIETEMQTIFTMDSDDPLILSASIAPPQLMRSESIAPSLMRSSSLASSFMQYSSPQLMRSSSLAPQLMRTPSVSISYSQSNDSESSQPE